MNATRYYVSRKNPLVWISALMALAAVGLQIPGLRGTVTELHIVELFFLRILPIWVGLGYAFIALVRGPEEFYRVTKPVFWTCVYFGAIALDCHFYLQENPEVIDSLHSGYALFAYKRYVFLCWFLYLGVYVLFRIVLTGGIKKANFLPLIVAVPSGILIYDMFAMSHGCFTDKLSNALLVLSVFVITFAMRTFNDGKYHKCWGDRPDGRRLRTVDPMAILIGQFMPQRNQASNCIRDTIEIAAVERYIHKKREEGLKNFGIMHVILAAYVRCVAKYPGLNRFFSGQRIHQRDDEIIFTMVIKRDMSIDSPESSIKLHLDVRDTADDVYHKLNAAIESVKDGTESSMDKLIGMMARLPRLVLKFTVWLLKLLDYFGKLPNFLLEESPFHGSVIFTSMGSLGIPPVTHHLFDFGNNTHFKQIL